MNNFWINFEPRTSTTHVECVTIVFIPFIPFVGNIGYIRYTARVTMDIPMGFDEELKQRFTVIRPLNLNGNPGLRVCRNFHGLHSFSLVFEYKFSVAFRIGVGTNHFNMQ